MSTEIIGIVGKQGCGKTMLMTYLGMRAYEKNNKGAYSNYSIYSNYHLNGVDYKPVSTLSDLEKMRDGVFLGDELWLWVFSRTSQSQMNKEINKIIMLNRKRNMDILYTAQRLKSIDVMLRSVTNHIFLPFLRKKDEDSSDWYLHAYMLDEFGHFITEIVLKKPIENYGQFYDTTEEISSLGSKAPIEKGIQLEEKFVSAIKKLGFDYVDILSNSGKDSSWCYDVIAYKDGKCYAFDVKSVTGNRITLKTYGHDLQAQIKNAYGHNAMPFIVFPNGENKQLSNPKFWYVYPLNYNSYLTKLSSHPSFNRLVKESMCLDNILNA
jgi:Holliday junction resolvase